jgi:MFS family permease
MNSDNRRALLVLMACAIGISVNFAGMISTTFAAFVKPLGVDFDWPRTKTMSGYSIATAALALGTWPVGALADRLSPHRILLFGVPAFGAALASLSFLTTSYPIYLLQCAIVGLSAAGCFHILYLSILAGSFKSHFGLALGIAVGAAGLSSAVMPSFAQLCIARYGWHKAFLILGFTSVVVAWPCVWLLLRFKKSGAQVANGSLPRPTKADGTSVRDALRGPLIWRLCICYFLMGALSGGHIANFIPLLTDRGVAAQSAAALSGLFGLSFFVARLACGYLLDRIDAGRLGAVVFLLGLCGVIWLSVSSQLWASAVGITLIGIVQGADGDIAMYIVRDLYGRRAFTTISGMIYMALLFGVLSGPLLLTYSFDTYHSYRPGQLLMIAGAVLSVGLHFNATGRSWRRRSALPQ